MLGYGGSYAYDELFKSPGEIRRYVIEEIAARFEGVDVESRLRPHLRPFLGGVNVSDLKLFRRDDPTRTPFLEVRAARGHLVRQGRLRPPPAPAKIELEDARLHVVRHANRQWNLQDIAKPGPDGRAGPGLRLAAAARRDR